VIAPTARPMIAVTVVAILGAAGIAMAGPETALREFAGGQIKKGVRTIGMGGDGATTGNYAVVYKDAGSAIFDQGVVRFRDTENLFTFSAVGLTTPSFWQGAAFYVIALAQQGNGVRVWDFTAPSASKPPSRGDLSDASAFVKFAKPIGKAWSIGLMGAFELSQASLLPNDGAARIRFQTSYLPSGGAGIHWHPDEHWQAGARVILNHDTETRTQAASSKSGVLRSYEYRLGVAYAPWKGTLLDVGGDVLDRSNGLEGTSTLAVHPTVGAEQALVRERVWIRGGLDETTWTAGLGAAFRPIKIDLAYLYNLAASRTQDVFGKRNTSLIMTITLQYDALFATQAPRGGG
jgi:hypothetical protein